MRRKDREQLVIRKYVRRDYTSNSATWEVEMQERYPLNEQELAVLKDLRRRRKGMGVVGSTAVPKKVVEIQDPVQPESESEQEQEQESEFMVEDEYFPEPPKRGRRRDRSPPSRIWSQEIFCDGRTVKAWSSEKSVKKEPRNEEPKREEAKREEPRWEVPMREKSRRKKSRHEARKQNHSREDPNVRGRPRQRGRPPFNPPKGFRQSINRILASNATSSMAVLQPTRAPPSTASEFTPTTSAETISQDLLVDISPEILLIHEPVPETDGERADVDDDGGVGRLLRGIMEEERNAIAARVVGTVDAGSGRIIYDGQHGVFREVGFEKCGSDKADGGTKRGLSSMMAQLMM
jgi:hypothetical protein